MNRNDPPGWRDAILGFVIDVIVPVVVGIGLAFIILHIGYERTTAMSTNPTITAAKLVGPDAEVPPAVDALVDLYADRLVRNLRLARQRIDDILTALDDESAARVWSTIIGLADHAGYSGTAATSIAEATTAAASLRASIETLTYIAD